MSPVGCDLQDRLTFGTVAVDRTPPTGAAGWQIGSEKEFSRRPLAVAFQVENELAQVVNSGVGEDG